MTALTVSEAKTRPIDPVKSAPKIMKIFFIKCHIDSSNKKNLLIIVYDFYAIVKN